MSRFYKFVWLACGLSIGFCANASADPICDLRTTTSTCTINGGIYSVFEVHPAGTGVIDSFVRIQDNVTEQGYNTSYRPVQFDEKTDPNFTRDLQVSELGSVMIEGEAFAAFYLDINEPAGGGKQYLTLDQLELYGTNMPMRTNYVGTANTADGSLDGATTTKLYDLDDEVDNYVQLDYNRIGSGSGSSDMVFYYPMAALVPYQYVNLFSQFGNINGSTNKFTSEAGFEEWFALQRTVGVSEIPEPGTLTLLGVGLLGLARRYQRRAE